jgi:hypothetical protein
VSARPHIQARLDALDRTLADWLAHLRHPAQFWPQFELLAAEILDECEAPERAHARAAIARMLKAHALELPPWHECGEHLPARRPRD